MFDKLWSLVLVSWAWNPVVFLLGFIMFGILFVDGLDRLLRRFKRPQRILEVTLHLKGGRRIVKEQPLSAGPVTEAQTAQIGEQLVQRFGAMTYELNWKR